VPAIALVRKERGWSSTMNNQLIGIAGVFALTFILLVLRHWFLSLGRPSRRRYVAPMALPGRHESNTKTVEDDSWLLWTPDSNPRTGPSRRIGDL
jgi:hypothetical protein